MFVSLNKYSDGYVIHGYPLLLWVPRNSELNCIVSILASVSVKRALLKFNQSHLFIFAFTSFTSGDKSKKNIAAIYVSVLPMFS